MKKTTADSPPFAGFSPRSLKFLNDLDRNNNREWFARHKDEFVQHVADPMKRLVADLAPMVLELDPQLVTAPNRVIARIHRDTRFSHDKSPYRPRIWLAFKRNVESSMIAPVFMFQLEGSRYLFGAGIACASPATMRCFREKVDADPKAFLKIIEPFRKHKSLKLESDRYKRSLPHEHGPIIDPWYQSKTIAVIAHREPDKTLYSKKLVDLLLDQYVLLKPLYDFLWSVTVR